MRDIVLILLILGSLPICLMRPSIGILVYSWLSYMNPHRYTWGFAFDFPFAQLVAIATLAGLFVTKEPKRFPMNTTVVIWIMFIVWMCITTIFALNPDGAIEGLNKVAKIQLMTMVTLYVMGSESRIKALVWVIALSMAFFGIKGGIFAVLTGGQHRVYGPTGSFIEDNNSLALALIMTLPLLRYLQLHANNTYLRWALAASIPLTFIAVLASQSRGALLGVCAMAAFLWLKSRHKIAIGLAILVALPIGFMMMPESWHERMRTIQTYEQDGSAMGRITAWRFTVKLANQRLTGGGFRGIENEKAYMKYAPDIHAEILQQETGAFRAAHSIWFGILGQHGWIGLILFVLLGLMAWRNGSWIIRMARGDPNLQWCSDLAAMLQVSIVGYAATGSFLSMEYFDYYYHIVALSILLSEHVRIVLSESYETSPAPAELQPTRLQREIGANPVRRVE